MRLTPVDPPINPGYPIGAGRGYSATVWVRRGMDGRPEAQICFERRCFSVYAACEAEFRQKLADLERKLAIDQLPPRD